MNRHKINDVKLDGINQSAYDCFVQQIMTLCLFYESEYWKLFIHSPIQYNDQNKSHYIDDYITTKDIYNIVNAMKKNYGIDLVKTKKMQFKQKEVYLISFDLFKYPVANIYSDISYEDTHCFIIYGEDKENYYIKDEFYGLSSYKMNKKIFNEGVKKIYRVNKMVNKTYNKNNDRHKVIACLKGNDYNVIEQWYQICLKHQKHDYHYAILFPKLRSIFSRAEHIALIIKSNSNNNPYFIKLAEMFHQIFNKLKNIWYNLMKYYLAYNKIDREVFNKNIITIRKLFLQQITLKKEAIKLLEYHRGSLKERLEITLNQYLEREVKLDECIYDEHDGITVLKLFNAFERDFCMALDIISYSGMRTYGEFIITTYEKILLSNRTCEDMS